MEIHHQPPNPARNDVLRTDLTRSNRKGIERALEHFQGTAGDRIELSDAARSLTKDLETVSEETAEHRQRVAELRELYREGRLNSRERIENAAEGLLRSPS